LLLGERMGSTSSYSLFLVLFVIPVLSQEKKFGATFQTFEIEDQIADDFFTDDQSQHHSSSNSFPKTSNSNKNSPDIEPFLEEPIDILHYDTDEFVGFEGEKPEAIEHTSTEKVEGSSEIKGEKERTYMLEIFYTILLIIYGIFFLVGRAKNENLAKEWAKEYSGLFMENFSKVGGEAMLSSESQSGFKLVATGRRYCIGLHAYLQMIKRHELVSMVLGLFKNQKDMIYVEIPMSEEYMEPFVFAITTQTNLKSFLELHEDVGNFGTIVNANKECGLDPSFVVYSSCSEIVPTLLHPQVVKTLNKYPHQFLYLHFTDRFPASVHYKHMLRFGLCLPGNGKMKELKTMTKMMIHFIDVVGRLKLSSRAKAIAKKQKTTAAVQDQKATHQQRQELAQKRKLDKLKKEQERMANLSEEQQAKLQLRQQRKEMKRKQKARFKVIHG